MNLKIDLGKIWKLTGKFSKFYFQLSLFMKTKYIGLLAILPLAMVALAPDFIAEADAQKAEGSPGSQPPKSYGSATDKIVCGDRLCDTKGESEPGNIGRAQ